MTAVEFKAARLSLGLSVAQMAAMLGILAQNIYRLERASERVSARRVQPTTARLIRAYLDGYRPPDWPR